MVKVDFQFSPLFLILTNNMTEKRSWFTNICPYGMLSGTHLHDINLEMIFNPMYQSIPNKKPMEIGDVIGYYGCSGWWYVYDEYYCIRLGNDRKQMEKDLDFILKNRHTYDLCTLCKKMVMNL